MFKKTLLFYIILLVIFMPYLFAEEAKETETPIVVNGDKVQYDDVKKTVAGTGNVSVTYKDMKMTCDKILVNIDKKEGIAEGNVTLYQGVSVFTADNVVYNFETKKAHLVEGGMQTVPWYGKAETIDKIDDKLFKLNKSYITTCDYEVPHYRIEAKTIKVYLGDRVTAWHVFFYAGETPIMYAPYYNHPLEDNLPQVQLVPGRNSEWGTFLLTAWRFYFHPDSKGYVHMDWRSRRGHAEGVDYTYKLRKFGKGYFKFYYLHDKEPDESQELGTQLPSKRWRVQLRHKWPVDENTFMVGEFHRLSDQAFIKDYFYNEEYEREKQPSTYLMLTGSKANYTLTFLCRKKINDFFTVVERLPDVSLRIRALKLFNHLDLYYKNESSFAHLKKKNAKDLGRFETASGNYNAARIDSYNELSYPFRILGFLNVNPFVGTRETFYSDDDQGNDNIVRYVLRTGVDFYTRFYKIYDLETDFLDLDINKIRHLIIPSAKYAYIPRPNLKPEELLQFDSIDGIRHQNIAELSLAHKLQTKRTTESGTKETVDVLTFIARADYIFRDDYKNENELGEIIRYDLEIRPYSWMYISANSNFHRRKKRFDIVNADLTIDEDEDSRYGVGYRYEKHENTQVTAYLMRHINKEDWKRHWAFEVYERYELQEKLFQEQEYTLIKDLHCWTGELTCRVKNESDYTFWVIFRLKAFPDMPFYFRTTYHGPEPGKKQNP